MKRMSSPPYTYTDVAQALADSMDIKRSTLLPKIVEATTGRNWLGAENTYTTAANCGHLCNLAECGDGKLADSTKVLGQLTKANMINLYEKYLLVKPNLRVMYDAIQNSALDECPYCAGLSVEVKTLDHYLPKSKYPRFSVLPKNLVPACSDCNQALSASSATSEEEQILHPYVDADHFFSEQWLYASYTESSGIQYRVEPPSTWSDIDKNRVSYHFNALDLASRLKLAGDRELSKAMKQVRDFENINVSLPDIVKCICTSPIKTNFANHWERVTYIALMEFLNIDYRAL